MTHITHFACAEQFAPDKPGCCCTGHMCSPLEQKELPKPPALQPEKCKNDEGLFCITCSKHKQEPPVRECVNVRCFYSDKCSCPKPKTEDEQFTTYTRPQKGGSQNSAQKGFTVQEHGVYAEDGQSKEYERGYDEAMEYVYMIDKYWEEKFKYYKKNKL